ncbi:glycosyl hydrolase family 18 protein [Cohnella lubricantis]|uniref:chitinase n=1 Tax=Cohnella lubricantis TaxID=2163172 RepID=A0A841T7J2_9BACL|nr:glycosyl hydrolase family 18 protein [Cohnella lubricantis]MBB6676069.1 S-layer homology domain-containing protein [Cohnella lubricantis]MBP2118024.1 chitinase [Cohnella lubricantis]
MVVRPKRFLPLALLLCLSLAFGSFVNTARTYAESDAPEPAPPESSSVVDATYATEDDAAHTGPTNLRIALDEEGNEKITHNTVTYEWDYLPDDANEIDVWNADTNAWLTWGNLTTHTLGSLKPETTYRIYITWFTDRPSLEYKSNVIEFTTLPDPGGYPEPPLTPPLNLRVDSLTDSSVTLKWKTSPGATGYDLYVNGGWAQGVWDGSLDTVTYQLPEDGSVAGAVYKFELGAQRSAEGEPLAVSKNSNAVTLTWGELDTPKDLQVVSANRTSVSLGWAAVPGATSYDIYRDGALVGTSEANRYLASGLREGQTYKFQVAARNGLWTSEPSAETEAVPGHNYNIITYYTSWSIYARDFQPEDIAANQITHINYAFSDLCWRGMSSAAAACQNDDVPLQKDYVYDGEMVVGDPAADLANFAALNELKRTNPKLKLMVSVGGWSWSNFFSDMAATEETRRAFANSVVEFLRAYQLDGLDIDWEYPVEGGEDDNSRRPSDPVNFTLLTQTVREALDAAGAEDGKYYLQTIASGQGDNFVVNANLAESVNALDFINIMTYDYHGSWETRAAHNSPLYYDENDPTELAERNNVQGGVLGHLNGGVPAAKLVVGIPFYGKGWISCPPDGEGQYQVCTSATPFGTWENGSFDFADLENNYADQDGYVRYWNEASKAAYLYNPEKQVFMTYNDKASMMYIASFVKSLNLAGVMSWEISGDRSRTLSTELARDLPRYGEAGEPGLAAPAQLRATGKSAKSIALAWDAVADATGYEVFVNGVLAGQTNETKWALDALTANTAYRIKVLAVRRTETTIEAVSPFSEEMSVTTSRAPSTSTPPAGTAPQPAAGQLETTAAKDGDRTVYTVNKDSALQAIAGSELAQFQIVIDAATSASDVIVPPEVMATLAAKGENAALSVIAGGTEFRIPVQSLPSAAGIRITVSAPSGEELNAMKQKLEAQGLTLKANPIQYGVAQLNADGEYAAIASFAGEGPSRIMTADGLNADQATGVVYVPKLGEFRSVPTLIGETENGKAAAILRDRGDWIYAVVETSAAFGDVTAEWAKRDAMAAAAKLIVSGESADTFGPNIPVTRAAFVSMIVRALGLIPDPAAAGSFSDVDLSSAYASDIELAKKLGIVEGKTDSLFDPAGRITREQMAVILANALRVAGVENVTGDISLLEKFGDHGEIASYAQSALAYLVEQNLLLGVSQAELAPRASLTRAQAAVVVMRMLRDLGWAE